MESRGGFPGFLGRGSTMLVYWGVMDIVDGSDGALKWTSSHKIWPVNLTKNQNGCKRLGVP